MLHLHAKTPERWLEQVRGNLEELLIDHAHCEKKAAGAALSLLFSYVEHEDLCRAMSGIVREELEHFELVLDLLQRRGIRFRRIPPSRYGERLASHARRDDPGRLLDRLIVAALIEARSCERFGLLRDHLPDQELAAFFGSLFESEARHHSVYLQLTRRFATEEEVVRRLKELADVEAALVLEGEERPRMHS